MQCQRYYLLHGSLKRDESDSKGATEKVMNGEAWNEFGYSSPEFDALLSEALATADVDKRREPDLLRLHELYKVLRGARDVRGAIDFETVETRIIFDEQKKIESIVPVVRNDAHKLIEECMLCANVAAAGFFEANKVPMLYRVHEGPNEEKLENLRKFLGELGLDLGGGIKPTPLDYQHLLEQVKDRDDAHVIQTMLLRSLSQAVYQPENNGHFGLHYDAYAHFTSPIRRYPDLLVHRGIRHRIRSTDKAQSVLKVKGAEPIPAQRIFPYDHAAMVVFGEHSSMAERRADDATREVNAWLKCEYLQDHVGVVGWGLKPDGHMKCRRKGQTGRVPDALHNQWSDWVPDKTHYDVDNTAGSKHNRRLMLMAPPQRGKTGTYLCLVWLLWKALGRRLGTKDGVSKAESSFVAPLKVRWRSTDPMWPVKSGGGFSMNAPMTYWRMRCDHTFLNCSSGWMRCCTCACRGSSSLQCAMGFQWCTKW